MLQCSEISELFLVHPLVPAGPIPTAQDPDGVYPYESFCETSRRPILRRLRLITLENDLVRAVICPDLGGRVFSLIHRPSGCETLYTSSAVRPIRILPRQFYIGGGIEVSFPISHTPTQTVPVLYRIEQRGGRFLVWCGERELRFGMHWTVEYSLGEKDTFLTQRTVFWNSTASPHPWMSWSNAGVPVRPDTEFHFPRGKVLYHGDVMETIDWEHKGPRRQSDMKRMAGFFWREPDCCAFGAFTPSLGCGLYHVADPALTPGIKLWTDGVGHHEDWVTQWTLDGGQCLEIQAGPLMDQSVKDYLAPGARRHHIEFWIPSDRPLDIHAIPLPHSELPPLEEVPQFGWARPLEVNLWEAVLKAWDTKNAALLPAPPDETDNRWAPSGMDGLGDALRWAADSDDAATRSGWLLQLGAWHAGRDEIEAALEMLGGSADDRARALEGRLFRRNRKDAGASVKSFRAIRSKVFALHPQVIAERDLALELLGSKAFAEREQWFQAVMALEDEWVIERRASLLADQERYQEAKHLLESTKFQLVHQRYARTRLWERIKRGLGLIIQDPPNWLGEDDLAEFGAYREYQEDAAF